MKRFAGRTVLVTGGGGAIGASYLGLALALRVQEITDVVALVRRRLGR